MAVQRRECDLVEIDQSDFSHARSHERRRGVRSDTATSHDNYERFPELRKAFVGKENPIARKLFEDEVWAVQIISVNAIYPSLGGWGADSPSS